MADQSSSDFRDGMPFVGGSLWVDLLNTTPVMNGRAFDFIGDAAHLSRWAAAARLGLAGVNTEAEADAAQALRVELRAAFGSMARGAGVPPGVAAVVNAALARIEVRRRLEISGPSAALVERQAVTPPVAAAAIAADFARFSCDYEPSRLKHCDNPSCTAVFYDRGKNNRRRWCSMTACGNRDKVANYRARKAQAQ